MTLSVSSKEYKEDKLLNWLQTLENRNTDTSQDKAIIESDTESTPLAYPKESMKFLFFSLGAFLIYLFFLAFHPSKMKRKLMWEIRNGNRKDEPAKRHVSIKAHEI